MKSFLFPFCGGQDLSRKEIWISRAGRSRSDCRDAHGNALAFCYGVPKKMSSLGTDIMDQAASTLEISTTPLRLPGREERKTGPFLERRKLRPVCEMVAMRLGGWYKAPLDGIEAGKRRDEIFGAGTALYQLGDRFAAIEHIHLAGYSRFMEQQSFGNGGEKNRRERTRGEQRLSAAEVVGKGFSDAMRYLENTKQDVGDLTILIFEDACGRLFDPLEINQAIQDALEHAIVAPDHIYLVETHDPEEWSISPLPQYTYGGWYRAFTLNPQRG